jgi:hypothetical protein
MGIITLPMCGDTDDTHNERMVQMESKLQKIEKMIAALQKEKGVNQRILLKMYIEKRNELKKQLNK